MKKKTKSTFNSLKQSNFTKEKYFLSNRNKAYMIKTKVKVKCQRSNCISIKSDNLSKRKNLKRNLMKKKKKKKINKKKKKRKSQKKPINLSKKVKSGTHDAI